MSDQFWDLFVGYLLQGYEPWRALMVARVLVVPPPKLVMSPA